MGFLSLLQDQLYWSILLVSSALKKKKKKKSCILPPPNFSTPPQNQNSQDPCQHRLSPLPHFPLTLQHPPLWLPAPSSPRNGLGQGYYQQVTEPNPTINAQYWLFQHPISGTSPPSRSIPFSQLSWFSFHLKDHFNTASSVLTTRIP